MRFRKLRIAWSVLSGVACLLLMVLWVRSYWHNAFFYDSVTSNGFTSVQSSRGQIGWLHIYSDWHPEDMETIAGFGWDYSGDSWRAVCPLWFPVLIVATFATAPWLRWRFSVRTLLIATTLVAVVLGLIVWLRI
jgi:hypothetical protein